MKVFRRVQCLGIFLEVFAMIPVSWVFRKFLFKSLCPVSARREYIVRKSPCPGIFSEVFLKSLCLSLGSGRGLGLGLDLGLG